MIKVFLNIKLLTNMAYRPPALRNSQNNRLDFLRDSRSTGWNNVQKKSYRKTNNSSSQPVSLPTHSGGGRVQEIKMNDRLKFLDEVRVPNVKKTFVAMPSEMQWNQGYRPAWMLREKTDPPEKFHDAMKIYNNYMKTGIISFPQKKIHEDKVKSVANQYAFKNSKKKS
jgi:hypothetical protein